MGNNNKSININSVTDGNTNRAIDKLDRLHEHGGNESRRVLHNTVARDIRGNII
jgi:hypothetical protein